MQEHHQPLLQLMIRGKDFHITRSYGGNTRKSKLSWLRALCALIAVINVLAFARATVSFAFSVIPIKDGIAIAASMASIAITTINSISVKPFLFFLRTCSYYYSFSVNKVIYYYINCIFYLKQNQKNILLTYIRIHAEHRQYYG